MNIPFGYHMISEGNHYLILYIFVLAEYTFLYFNKITNYVTRKCFSNYWNILVICLLERRLVINNVKGSFAKLEWLESIWMDCVFLHCLKGIYIHGVLMDCVFHESIWMDCVFLHCLKGIYIHGVFDEALTGIFLWKWKNRNKKKG